MERFQDENKWLGNFEDIIDVKCPKCSAKAGVKRTYESKYLYRDTRILECKHCYFAQKGQMKKFKAIVDTFCCNNEDKIKYESQILNEKPEKINLKCPICMEHKDFKPKIEEITYGFNADVSKQRESYFNCELWYQKQFDNAIFWAYNRDHIEYLERYIRADLRERNNDGSFNKTLVSRLPQFVKSAKNREKLLKSIEKWKK
ncbi:hypothetical protein SY27_15475 [Flavobacterium sp. 316]|uniref:hypothetical protein n=1 Tax=Flavobacterium sp. 316 TaxID=1603293 RepID=UPI0005E5CA02|nr:hypothetical protein [Flavobacterium sp. 316]KIX19927.1 hypothetical protein SY27_15475 [Flavobacterium sp. 316]